VKDQRESLLDKLHGILLPTTTNFNQDGSIDLTSLRFNLAKWLTTDITGLVLLGSTGERVHLNEREYLQIIQTARAEVQSDRVLIVGAGQQSTIGTINEIQIAKDAGADAVLVITPHFYRAAITQEALISFYTAVADAAHVPLLLYSMPALTGVKIEPETIARLSEHPNILGVKDSSNEMVGFSETVKLCPDDFAVMTGNGTVLLDALKAGATGGILAVGCAVPEICLQVFRLFGNGEFEQAELLQTKLTPFAAAVTTRFGIGGLKAALDIAGYRGGPVRQPLQSPNSDQIIEIKNLFEDLFVTFEQLSKAHYVNSNS
jgi:dihydrodipicolinate synthase/N-acetylneuraminate lyase